MKFLFKNVNRANQFITGTLLFCFFAIFIQPLLSLFIVYAVSVFKETFDDRPNSSNTFYIVLGSLPVYILFLIQEISK